MIYADKTQKHQPARASVISLNMTIPVQSVEQFPVCLMNSDIIIYL